MSEASKDACAVDDLLERARDVGPLSYIYCHIYFKGNNGEAEETLRDTCLNTYMGFPVGWLKWSNAELFPKRY